MFAAGVPDKVIAEFTVPRTPMALHQYVHTSVDQVKASGFAVSGNAPNDRKPLVAVENPKVDMEDKKPDSDTLQQSVPTFLGNLTNCTINIKLWHWTPLILDNLSFATFEVHCVTCVSAGVRILEIWTASYVFV